MERHYFVLRKIQHATITQESEKDETVEDVCKRIEEIPEEEMDFSDPEYELLAISRDEGKISKLLWTLTR